MDNTDKIAQAEPSPPPYAEQANGTQLGYPPQAGYPAQPGYPVQPGYPAQPGYPQKESYPTQKPYTAQTGPAQPGYPLQTYPPFQGQQTSTTVVTVQPTQAVILATPAPPRPQSWLCLSIFCCLFFCWPVGLCAITYSSRVNSSYAAGDYEGARKNAKNALTLNILAFIGGVIIILVSVIG